MGGNCICICFIDDPNFINCVYRNGGSRNDGINVINKFLPTTTSSLYTRLYKIHKNLDYRLFSSFFVCRLVCLRKFLKTRISNRKIFILFVLYSSFSLFSFLIEWVHQLIFTWLVGCHFKLIQSLLVCTSIQYCMLNFHT